MDILSQNTFATTMTLFIGTLIISFNAFIFIIFIRLRVLRQNSYHFLVLLLSFCDFLVGLGYFSHVIETNLSLGDRFFKTICVVKFSFLISGTFLSLLQTFLISLQRYLVICHTSWNNRLFRNSRKYIVCFSGWLTVLIFTIGLISPPDEPLPFCQVQYVYKKNYHIIIHFMQIIVALLLATVGLYFITLRYIIKRNRTVVAKTQHNNCDKNTDKDCSTSSSRGEKNISQIQDTKSGKEVSSNIRTVEVKPFQVLSAAYTVQPHESKNTGQTKTNPIPTGHQKLAQLKKKKLLNTVVLLGMLLCCLIFFSLPLILTFFFYDEVPDLFLFIAACLCGMNSIINPVLYCVKIETVRSTVKNLLCRCK